MTEKKVFVVDDDRLIQNFLEYALLGKGGYEVIVFTQQRSVSLIWTENLISLF
jgi:DNA-binding NtrC family response regulator